MEQAKARGVRIERAAPSIGHIRPLEEELA
jgi:hypothetical protein